MLKINIPKTIESKLIEFSQEKNLNIETIVIQAISQYLNEQDEFMRDLKMWDKLSDEAWSNFEKECL